MVKPKDHYGEVKKGTIVDKIRELLARKEGCTSIEAYHLGLITWKYRGKFRHVIGYLENMYGYEVFSYTLPNANGTKVYKIVGRWTWQGDYKEYIKPEEYMI